MSKPLLITLFVLFTVVAMAQNHGALKGKVADSLNKAPIEYATVAVLNAKDTTAAGLLAYAQSDKDGLFKIDGLPLAKPLKAVISFVGYKPFIRFFTLVKGQTMDMSAVQLSPRQLNEVVVHAERIPIVVRKDTIEFDAAAFKTRPNAVVEDLLKKLPGVEIDFDGNVTVMGKGVSKVLVNGREFFVNDPKMATKNLDAEMIDKVQIYDDRENDPDHLVPDNDVKKIVNLKFKKKYRKSVFGKMYGGGGTQDHYQAGGLFNMFRDTLQVSVLGYSNNLNSTGFNFNDLYMNGGMNRGGSLGYGWDFYGNGKQTATNTGININNDYGKKLKTNLSYLYKHNRTQYSSTTNSQQFISDTTLLGHNENYNQNIQDGHELNGSIKWQPKDGTTLNYTPGLTIYDNNGMGSNSSTNYRNFTSLISNSTSGNNSDGSNLQFKQDLNYNQQLKKQGSTLSINHSLSVLPGNKNNAFNNTDYTSYQASFPSYTLRQLAAANNKAVDGSINTGYHYTFNKKINATVSATVAYGDHHDKATTYNYNATTGEYDLFLQNQSSDLDRIMWAENVNNDVNWALGKNVSLETQLNFRWQQAQNIFDRNSPQLNQHFFDVLPVIRLGLKGFNLIYSRSIDMPNIGDMIPYRVVFSPQYSVIGNPNLKRASANNFNINYNKYNYQSGTTFYLNGGARFEQNSIFRQRTVDANLVETSTPINRNGRYSYNLGATLNKQFKKSKDWELSANTQVNTSFNHNFFVINHQDGSQNNLNFNFNEFVNIRYKDKFEIDPQYSISSAHTTYTGVDYSNQSYLSHSVSAHFNVSWPHINVDGNYNYRYNPMVPSGFQKSTNLMTMSISRQFLKKDQAEIKFSCYDIFNQNIGITRSINQNIISDTESQIIKRYFLVTLQFKFLKSTVKANAGQKEMSPVKTIGMPMIFH